MLSLRTSLVGLMLGAMALMAHAHGPTPQKVEEKIEIAAPPEKVWGIIKDFGKLDWNPAISKIESTGGNENNASRTSRSRPASCKKGSTTTARRR